MKSSISIIADREKGTIEVIQDGKQLESWDIAAYIYPNCTRACPKGECSCPNALDSYFRGLVLKYGGRDYKIVQERYVATITPKY